MNSYCKPDQHTWTKVVGGKGYDEDFDTMVCVKCECYSGTRKTTSKPWAHPDTMIGRR